VLITVKILRAYCKYNVYFVVDRKQVCFKMAFSTNEEYDTVEFLMFEHTKHVVPLCDIDLTCYETFYDSSPSEDKNRSAKEVHCKCDLDCLEAFERNETNNGNWSRVPDVDCMWLYTDGGLHDVLKFYDIIRGELFSEFSSDDTTTCLSYGVDSLAVPTTLGLQKVPTLMSESIGINSQAVSVQQCSSPSTPEKGGSKAKDADKRSVIISLSPATSTESDSQDDDARVPSSCRSEFLPSGWYYIEE